MSWDKRTLGELCQIEKGKIGIQKATSGEFPLVVTSEKRLTHNEYHFEGNAVVIPLVSSTGHGHRSLKRIHFQSGKFAVGNILCAVIPNDETILRADYLYRFLDLNREKELVGRMRGMANVTLPIKEIAQIEIPVPPIEDQIKFVEQYLTLEEKSNDLSGELTDQLDLVKQLRQAFLREAMQGKLMPQDSNDESASVLLEKIKAEKERLIKEKKIKKDKPLPPITENEVPFEIPKNWVWCRLGKILHDLSYGTSKSCSYDNKKNSKVLRIPNISQGYIDIEDLKYTDLTEKDIKELSLQAGDILTIRSNGSRELVGKTVLVTEEVVGYTYAGYLIRLRFNNDLINPKFILKATNSPFYRELIETPLRTTVGINNINSTELSNLLIPLPPLSEQQRIVAKLDELMQYCDELEASIKESQQQNELLLQQVLREALEPKVKETVG